MPTGADVTFDTYAFPVVTGGASRNAVQRATDVYNVKDYYYSTDGSNATLMIQRAVDAANASSNPGGTIFIPPGNYVLNSRVYVGPFNNSSTGVTGTTGQALRFLGCGADAKGTVLNMSARDYIIYQSIHGTAGKGITSVQGIAFNNSYTGTNVTQIEPPSNSPDGVSGDGVGCLYIGSGVGFSLRDCFLQNTRGVGFFHGGFQGTVDACSFQGSFNRAQDSTDFSGSQLLDCIAIMSRALHIRDGKIGSYGIGVACFKGHSQIEFMDIERCGIGIQIGNNPYAYWDSNESVVAAAGSVNFLAGPGIFINNIVMESSGEKFIDCINSFGEIRNVDMYSGQQVGIPNYGIDCSGASRMEFYNLNAHGGFQIAGINVGASGGSQFIYCSSAQSGGSGTHWLFPSSQLAGVVKFVGCLNNSHVLNCALPLSILPAGGYSDGQTMECSDSTDPAWTAAGVSNVGKRIVGSGSNRVTARYGALATATASGSWTAGGASTTITATATIPASVVAGVHVWSTSVATKAQYFIGYISSVSGSTVTVTPGASAASGGSSDNLIFAAWLIAG